MAYCTLSDLKKQVPENVLVQLTDDEGLGAINQTRVDQAIAQADAEIDAYCGARYSTPFGTVPDVIKMLSADIAIYNLYSRRVSEMPELRSDRYKSAIKRLEGISKGIVSLGLDPEPSAPSEGGVETNKTESERKITDSKLSGY